MQGIKDDPIQRGVIPNSFEHIFSHISHSRDEQFLVRAAYLEIYMVCHNRYVHVLVEKK